MIQFFRKIRQNLIRENRVSKYLLYALGEILLVVIGILIAFQVNDWNDNRIKRNAEINYYRNIRNLIAADKYHIQGQIEYNDFYKVQFEYANGIIDANDRTELDTLGIIASNLTNYSDYDRQSNIYETMVNSGEIKLLRNHSIIDGLRELEHQYLYINRMENIHYDVVIKYVIPSTSTTIKFSNLKIQKPDELYSFEFQNIIVSLISIMEEKNEVYLNTIEEIDRVTELINQELNTTTDP